MRTARCRLCLATQLRGVGVGIFFMIVYYIRNRHFWSSLDPFQAIAQFYPFGAVVLDHAEQASFWHPLHL